MRHLRRVVLLLIPVLSLLSPLSAAPLLADHFGVHLTVSPVTDWEYAPGQTYSGYYFDRDSFAPTLNTGTVDYQVNDWFGQWAPEPPASMYGVTHPDFAGSTLPAGGEPYDTEAYYFDDDEDNLYFAAIIGFPSPDSDIFIEPRLGWAPVVQGDFAIDIVGTGSGQTDNWGFQYDFGVDLTHEERPPEGWDVGALYDTEVGNQLYQTDNGWYLGSPGAAVYPIPGSESGSFTNFDPGASGLSSLGAVTANWYQLPVFDQYGVAMMENNAPTYAIEITIPRTLLPELDPYQEIRFQWLAGCRNDANDAQGYLSGSGVTPEPTTATLLLLGAAPLGLWLRRRRGSTT